MTTQNQHSLTQIDDNILYNSCCSQWSMVSLYLLFQSGVPFRYVITECPKKNNKNGKEKTDKGETKTKDQEFKEAERDLKISWLSK